ncbi:MAG: hypothetical protein FJ125_15845, partial [Deltaproteobacteria bacterium]|nr:hypothetical protein [Deltaproteobacteria bacterium]
MPTLFSRSLPCSRAAIHGTSADASAGRRVAGRILLLLLVLPLLLAAAALSCGGDGCSCGPAGKEEPRAPLLSRVSMDVLGILLVPRTDRLATQLRGLYDRFLSQFPDLAKMAGDIRSQTGIDLLRPETIGEIGLDPAGELLLAVHPDWVLFGLSLSSSERFERYLRDRFARELPGMLEFRAAKAGERDAWLVAPRQPAGAPPVLGYVTLGDQMLIVPGQGPQQQPVDPLVRLAGALALPAERSLPVAAPGFADLLAAAGEEPGAVAWLNTVPLARVLAEQARGRGAADEARFHDGLGRALTGLALGLTVSGDRLALAGKGLVEAEQYR